MFVVVFSLFVLATLVLIVVTVRWAIRRDREGRQRWLAERAARESGEGRDDEAP